MQPLDQAVELELKRLLRTAARMVTFTFRLLIGIARGGAGITGGWGAGFSL